MLDPAIEPRIGIANMGLWYFYFDCEFDSFMITSLFIDCIISNRPMMNFRSPDYYIQAILQSFTHSSNYQHT